MSLRGRQPEAIPCFMGYFNSKEDCHAATPSLAGGAREEQERRLAMTSICEMYGREEKYKWFYSRQQIARNDTYRYDP